MNRLLDRLIASVYTSHIQEDLGPSFGRAPSWDSSSPPFLSSPRAYLFHQPDLNHVYRQSDPNQDAAPCAVLIGRCFLLAASDRHTDRRQTDQQHGGDDEDERASYSHDINNAAKRPSKTDNAANGLVAVPPTFVVGLDDFHWICFYWCQMAIDTPFILRANIPT